MPTRHAQQPVAANDYATAPAAGLPRLPNGKTQLEALNERVLKQYIPDLTSILKIAPYTVVYTFSPETQQWEKSGCEGSMFLCAQADSRSSVFVLNRKSMDNFHVELKSPEDIEITSEYVIMQSTHEDGTPEIYGIWFYNAEGQTSKEEMGTAIMDAAAETEQAHQGEYSEEEAYEEPEIERPSDDQYGSMQGPAAGVHGGGQQMPQTTASIDLLKLFSKPQIQQETHVAAPPIQHNMQQPQNAMTGQQVDLLRLFGKPQQQSYPHTATLFPA